MRHEVKYGAQGQRGGRNGGQGRGRDWPGGACKFTRCVLYKENLETQASCPGHLRVWKAGSAHGTEVSSVHD